MPRVTLVALLYLAGCSPVAPIGAGGAPPSVTVEPVGIAADDDGKFATFTYRVSNHSDRQVRVAVNLSAYDENDGLVCGATVSAGGVGPLQTTEPTAFLKCTGRPVTMRVSVATAY